MVEIPEEFVLAKEQLKKIVLFLSRPEVIRGVKATEENALEIVQAIFNELLAEQKRSKVFQAALKADPVRKATRALRRYHSDR